MYPSAHFDAKYYDRCTCYQVAAKNKAKMYLLPILLSRTMTHVPTTHSVAKNNDQNVPAAHFVAKNNHPCTHYSFCCQEQSPIYLLSILLPRTFTHVPATHFDAEEQ